MTIPIVPGPFSFLQGAGQTLGSFGDQKEKVRQQQIKEASDILNKMIELRSKGFGSPEMFTSPEAMNIYSILGITPPGGEPTYTEVLEKRKRDILSPPAAGPTPAPGPHVSGVGVPPGVGMISGVPELTAPPLPDFDPYQLSLLGLPQAGELAKDRLTAIQSTAAEPRAAEVVRAVQEETVGGLEGAASTRQYTMLDELADTHVQNLYNLVPGRPRLPTAAEAYQAALQDPDPKKAALARGAGPAVFARGVERMRAKLAGEEAKILRASMDQYLAQGRLDVQRQVLLMNMRGQWLKELSDIEEVLNAGSSSVASNRQAANYTARLNNGETISAGAQALLDGRKEFIARKNSLIERMNSVEPIFNALGVPLGAVPGVVNTPLMEQVPEAKPPLTKQQREANAVRDMVEESRGLTGKALEDKRKEIESRWDVDLKASPRPR